MDTSIEEYLKQNLTTEFTGRKVFWYPVLTSTMDEGRKLASAGALEGTVVIAGQQTAGRGRLKRNWLSPEGSLSMSVILKPPLKYLPSLIMVYSLAVVKAIESACGICSAIKWPNDVLIEGQKVCGILIENEIRSTEVAFSVTGIGINVDFDPALHPDIAVLATSLSRHTHRNIAKEELCCSVLNEIERLYLDACAGRSLRRQWQERMETVGRSIRVRSGNTVIEGRAEAVEDDGRLLLRRQDGTLEHIAVGDVTIIKE